MPPSTAGSSVNRPLPATRPTWSTPMTAPSIHSVTYMRSVTRSGPTRVSTAMRVPTPRRCGPSNRMASASAIQSTWRSIGSTTAQTSAGGASITTET